MGLADHPKPHPHLTLRSEEEEELRNDDKKTPLVIVERVLHSDYKRMFEDFHNNKFDSIKGRISAELERLKESPPIDIPSVSDILSAMEIQSLENINFIREEFRAPPGRRNIEKLEKMLNFNKFFIILNKGTARSPQKSGGKSSTTLPSKNTVRARRCTARATRTNTCT